MGLNLTGFLPLLNSISGYGEVKRILASPQTSLPSSVNILESARPYFLAGLHRDSSLPILVLTSRRARAQEVKEQLQVFSPYPEQVHLFLEPEPLPFERAHWEKGTVQGRLRVLSALEVAHRRQKRPSPMVVASIHALTRKTIPRDIFASSRHSLKVGEKVERDRLLSRWLRLGHEPESIVEEPGQFAVRGGIIDVFPIDSPHPIRIELAGEQIASLRSFDPNTQRSQEPLPSLLIGPAREVVFAEGSRDLRKLGLAGLNSAAREEYEKDLSAMEEGQFNPFFELYIPHLYSPSGSLLEYFPQGSLVAIDDPLGLEQTLRDLEEGVAREKEMFLSRGEIPSWLASPYFTVQEIESFLEGHRVLQLGSFSEEPMGQAFRPAPAYGGRLPEMIADTLGMVEDKKVEDKKGVVVVSRQAPRLQELYGEGGVSLTPIGEMRQPPKPGGLVLVSGGLTRGWEMHTAQGTFLLMADGDIFGWSKLEMRRTPSPRPQSRESFFADVTPGDFVVHIEHGIGIYDGLATFRENGVEREFLKVDYAQGDTLYVPTYHADRLSRYLGSGGAPPRIDRLGTADWERTVAQAKRAVEEIAQELLQLYSAREVVPGYAFPQDAPWQYELEASFPYLETEDQVRTLREVKRDMAMPRPMDRLICGDVGYGKTEVALRAAFKAVMSGKQVALLVPTTVLAQQHFLTFQKRLAPFPVEVEMLSRFRSAKDQKQILENLEAGKLDIVIGTHRLLQKDVQFRDLGLLIIDEEQRFGVKDKERLKALRKEVDVLTLTATPIPRTLYLSLAGARDMSTIETPPQERLAVITQVTAYDEPLIRRAVLRELDRGGQVYFVHNRVRGIDYIASRLKRLVPEARIVVVHGQMEEKALSQTMLEFAEGEHDVLVSTSIIENGIDIPNVNTLLVNRADRFGLAELYQLRGRVGRGALQAYAYFLYDEGRLSKEAREKLRTIQEAGQLGSGFRIAMRDLEIRGAGEMLGARQHGHIAAVGFDLYTKLLARAVADLKSGKAIKPELVAPSPIPEVRGPSIDLPLQAYLPQDYVADPTLRLSLYRRLAGLSNLDEVEAMEQELRDRFGEIPEPAQNLLYVLRLKVLAMAGGVDSLDHDGERVLVRLKEGKGRASWNLPSSARGRGTLLWVPYSPFSEAWRDALQKTLQSLSEANGRGG
ncbi:MAG: transcription-repair coupling factor [Chloroflexi bacterium]|nr:transcription-repair coupling factor [Chloroflexota bacterium]